MEPFYGSFSPLNSERRTLANSSTSKLIKILDLKFTDGSEWERTHFSPILKHKKPNKCRGKDHLLLLFSFLCLFYYTYIQRVEKKQSNTFPGVTVFHFCPQLFFKELLGKIFFSMEKYLGNLN